jgi:adenosylhomocysteinase
MASLADQGGADVVLCASNPLSTQDDVAAALVSHYEMPVYAIKGEDNDTYYRHLHAALDHKPHIVHGRRLPTWSAPSTSDRAEPDRQHASAAPKRPPPALFACGPWPATARCKFPMMAVNDAMTKHLFDNRYGTGRVDAGRHHSRHQHPAGRAQRRRRRLRLVQPRHRHARPGLGANVIVTEIDPLKALEAVMDGFRVMPMAEASPIGDIFMQRHRRHPRLRRASTSRA